MKTRIPKLIIDGIEVKIPIIQGGMGVGVSLSGLASAVANQGGIGVIATAGIGMLEPDFDKNFTGANKRALRKEIRRAKKMTKGIIGVNIMLALSDYDELSMIAMEEGADLLFLGAGLPLQFPETLPIKLKKVPTKIVPIVSSAKAVRIIFQYWARNYEHIPDAVVVEGPLAGGHLGYKKEHIHDPEHSLDKILPEVISELIPFEKQFKKSVPVIAGGGIYTGADIYKYIQLGAKGVQMGTRFVATDECDADIRFKQAYINCREEDLIIIESPVGLPGRAIRNQFSDDVSSGIKKPFQCPWQCLKTCDYENVLYCIALALTNAKRGELENGFVFAGANAYRIDKIISVKKLFKILLEEYKNKASQI